MRWHCRRQSGRRTSLFNHQFNPSIAFALKRCREWRRRRYHDLARRTVTYRSLRGISHTSARKHLPGSEPPRPSVRQPWQARATTQVVSHDGAKFYLPSVASNCSRRKGSVLCVKSRRTIRGPSQYFVNPPRTQLPAAYFRALRLTVIRARGASFASFMIGSFCCFISCRPESGESDFPDHHSQCLPRIR